jgi:hypothetical protein
MNAEVEVAPERSSNAGEGLAVAQHLMDHIEHQIRSTDTKAVFIATANAFLVSSLVSFLKPVSSQVQIAAVRSGLIDVLAVSLTTVALLALIGSTLCALLVIRPWLNPPESHALMFFGAIGAMPERTFVNEFRGLNTEQLAGSVLAQVHAKSRIASGKYAEIKWSINFLIVGLILWAISVVFHVALG